MKTDDLIRALAIDVTPARPIKRVLFSGLVPALAVAVLVVWIALGFRADLMESAFVPLSAVRFILTGSLALLGTRIALLLARPEGVAKARLWPLAAVVAGALALLVWAYIATPGDARQMAVVGKTMTTCLVTIPLLAILPVASILFMLRQGATTAPITASAVAGLAGGGAAAAIYALHCTEDSPLFYVTWYGLAIIGVMLISVAVGPRLLRW